MTEHKLLKELIDTARELREVIDDIKESLEMDDEELDFLRDFFKDYNSSYSLSLAYPEELWVATAKSIGIDVEGKDRLQLAKEVFTRSSEMETRPNKKSQADTESKEPD
jgi:hypothetical protein